jgi:hypothetical protein
MLQPAEPSPPFHPTWVLLIDVAGFSRRMLEASRRERLAAVYVKIARDLPNADYQVHAGKAAASRLHAPGTSAKDLRHPPGVDLQRWHLRIFSDSLFLFFHSSTTDGPTDRYMIARASKDISRALWKERVAHRGAIAFGEALILPDVDVFLGEPIVKAHWWEAQQDWFGISIEPGSLSKADFVDHNGSRLLRAEVPTKSGVRMTAYVNAYEERVNLNAAEKWADEEVVEGFIGAYREALEEHAPGALEKYARTASILQRHVESAVQFEQLSAITNRHGPTIRGWVGHVARSLHLTRGR